MIEDLASFPPLSNIRDLPPGVTPQDIRNLPPGINLSELANINPNDPNSINVICENGMIKPGLAPFVPSGIGCPPSGFGPTTSSGGPSIPGNIDTSNPSSICENGMIKPGFEPFVPPGFNCSLLNQLSPPARL